MSNAAELTAFANQMIAGVTGLQKSMEAAMKNSFEKMSKEDAKKFAEAMRDSGVIEMARKNAEDIMNLNKNKKD